MGRNVGSGIVAVSLVWALSLAGCESGWDASDQVAINVLESVGETEWSWPEARDDGDPLAVWVFFHDKDVPAARLDGALEERRRGLTTRALDRRALRGAGPLVSEQDLDVAQTYVDAVLATGAELRITSRWLNAVTVDADLDQVEAIEALPFVTHTRVVAVAQRGPDRRLPDSWQDPLPIAAWDVGVAEEQLEFLGVLDAHECWVTGAGLLVGVQDTGFTIDHEALSHVDVVDEYDFVNDDPITSDEAGDIEGHHNHGTAVLSLLTGHEEGDFRGVVPDASVLLTKTEDLSQEVSQEEDYFVAGLEWIEARGADVFSTSLGYIDWWGPQDTNGQTAPTSIAVAQATSQGMVTVVASGNTGPDPMSLAPPGDAIGAIAVGAVGWDGTVSDFSARGPTADGRVKPDLVGPGEMVWAASALDTDAYGPDNGTSFAAPLVAGIATMGLQAHPAMNPAALRSLMTSTASNAGAENNDIGSGVPAAMEVIGEYCPCSDGDGDGHADMSCGGDDCNDSVDSVHPGAEETCDGYDSDCDGTVPPDELDGDGDGHLTCGDDCDDTDPDVYHGADEIPYDGIDQDCSGADQTDVDGDGYPGGPNGTDCDDTHATAHPDGEEDCGDTLDNDCDGDVDGADEDCPGTGDWSAGGNDGNWGCFCDLDSGDKPNGALVVALLAGLLLISRRR